MITHSSGLVITCKLTKTHTHFVLDDTTHTHALLVNITILFFYISFYTSSFCKAFENLLTTVICSKRDPVVFRNDYRTLRDNCISYWSTLHIYTLCKYHDFILLVCLFHFLLMECSQKSINHCNM